MVRFGLKEAKLLDLVTLTPVVLFGLKEAKIIWPGNFNLCGPTHWAVCSPISIQSRGENGIKHKHIFYIVISTEDGSLSYLVPPPPPPPPPPTTPPQSLTCQSTSYMYVLPPTIILRDTSYFSNLHKAPLSCLPGATAFDGKHSQSSSYSLLLHQPKTPLPPSGTTYKLLHHLPQIFSVWCVIDQI